MYGHGASVSSESPDKHCIHFNNKRKNTLDTSIKVKESIEETENPSKRSKEDTIPHVGKKKHLHHLKIRKTELVIIIRRRVVTMILQVKLMVV